MKGVVLLVAILAVAPAAAAQTADDYRGGWRTDGGEAHTYQFSIRGNTVRGIYCTYCADATTLAFVDGTFGPEVPVGWPNRLEVLAMSFWLMTVAWHATALASGRASPTNQKAVNITSAAA